MPSWLLMCWKYLRYLVRHKWFVFLEGRKLGVPLIALIIHDWSKFLPSEFLPYARFFYGPHTRVVAKTAGEARAKAPAGVASAFDVAWLLHQNRQPHHWQFWIIHRDNGTVEPLLMPAEYMLEMLADWRGAGRAVGFPDTTAWYLKNHAKIVLRPANRDWIEQQLGVGYCDECNRTARLDQACTPGCGLLPRGR